MIRLEGMLPSGTPILGIDEHTACILDFLAGKVLIRGVGGVTLRRGGSQKVFQDGTVLTLDEFKRMALPAETENLSVLSEIETTKPAAGPSPGNPRS